MCQIIIKSEDNCEQPGNLSTSLLIKNSKQPSLHESKIFANLKMNLSSPVIGINWYSWNSVFEGHLALPIKTKILSTLFESSI